MLCYVNFTSKRKKEVQVELGRPLERLDRSHKITMGPVDLQGSTRSDAEVNKQVKSFQVCFPTASKKFADTTWSAFSIPYTPISVL